MRRVISLLGFLLLALSLPAFAQESFTKVGGAAPKAVSARWMSANSVPFKASVASPAMALGQAQIMFSLCSSPTAGDAKCPQNGEVSGTIRLTIRGADGKTIATEEANFRQAASTDKESFDATIPISVHTVVPILEPGSYVADLEVKAGLKSEGLKIVPGRVSVIVLKSRLH